MVPTTDPRQLTFVHSGPAGRRARRQRPDRQSREAYCPRGGRSTMERFARLIVAGGLALAAGLWIATLAEARTAAWLLGVGVAALGAGANVAGVVSELEL